MTTPDSPDVVTIALPADVAELLERYGLPRMVWFVRRLREWETLTGQRLDSDAAEAAFRRWLAPFRSETAPRE